MSENITAFGNEASHLSDPECHREFEKVVTGI